MRSARAPRLTPQASGVDPELARDAHREGCVRAARNGWLSEKCPRVLSPRPSSSITDLTR